MLFESLPENQNQHGLHNNMNIKSTAIYGEMTLASELICASQYLIKKEGGTESRKDSLLPPVEPITHDALLTN